MWRLGRQGETADWDRVDTPTGVTLTDGSRTAVGPHAVGHDGVLLVREEQWQLAFDDGPMASHQDLLTMAPTGDGGRVWFAGTNGAVGFYDVHAGEKHDWSQPTGSTANFEALTVAGDAGQEKLLLAGGGTIHPGYVEDCRPTWDEPVGIDGDGTVTALEVDADGYGYAATTRGRVYETTPDDEWQQLGVENTQSTFPAIHVTEESLWVSSTSGRVHRYDREQETWTTLDIGTDTIRGFAGVQDSLFAVGDTGQLYRRESKSTWVDVPTPTTADLLGAVATPHIAVGQHGVVLERQ